MGRAPRESDEAPVVAFALVITTPAAGSGLGPGSGAERSGRGQCRPAQGTGDPPITTTSLPSGTVGASYSQTVGVVSTFPPLTRSVVSGALPPGLSVPASTAGSGAISGTPTTAGTYSFTVQAIDVIGDQSAQALSITVSRPVAPLTVRTVSLSAATVSRVYAQVLVASGGTLPYTWSVLSGSLPRGLALRGNGVIAGTPTTLGTFRFTVRVTDRSGATATRALSIQVVRR
jgi:putative Ig domain-containing protein